jgi:hypothetical protein
MMRSRSRRFFSLPAIRKHAARLTLEHLEARDVPSLFNTLSAVTVSGVKNFGCVATGDFTGNGKDGLTDLVMTNQGQGVPGENEPGNTLTILEPTGNGTFKVSSTITVGTGQYVAYVAVGDLNGDGIPDLAVASTSENGSGNLTIFLGNGSGGFTKGSTYSTGLDNVDWVGIAPMFAGSTVPSIVISGFGETQAGSGGGGGSSSSGSGTTVTGSGIDLYQMGMVRSAWPPISVTAWGSNHLHVQSGISAVPQITTSPSVSPACPAPRDKLSTEKLRYSSTTVQVD